MSITADGAIFSSYVRHGLVLVPVLPGEKRPINPQWQLSENCIRHPLVAGRLTAAGLAHAYSGTCVLDIDDIDAARNALHELGFSLDRALSDAKMVRIDSGQPGRAKFVFKLETPLVSRVLAYTADKRHHAAQLRCATADGKTVQDILPPSKHPAGNCYSWAGDWHNIPLLPEKLLNWWKASLSTPVSTAAPKTETKTNIASIVENADPDCNYDDWIRIGMALHHESNGSDDGFQLWDGWSSGGNKYKGRADLYTHWKSFGKSNTPVTAASFRQPPAIAAEDFPIVLSEEKEETPKLFEAIHVSKWAKKVPPPWLIQNVLPQSGIGMLYGAAGTGKSFFGLDMAFAVARGVTWREHKVAQGAVAWIAAEAPGSMRNRVRAYANAININLEEVPLWIIGDTPMLNEKRHLTALLRSAVDVQAKMIIIDTLAAASGGVNENSPDMNVIISACSKLYRATNASLLIIHHSGKDAARGARGWSGIEYAMDTTIEITRPSADNAMRLATIVKQRDADDKLLMPFILRTAPADLEHVSCVVEHLSQAVAQNRLPKSAFFETAPMGPHIQAAIIAAQVHEPAAFEDLL